MDEVLTLVNLIRASLGQEACDLVLKGCHLVNLFSEDIFRTDIAIKGDTIVSILPGIDFEAKEVLDCSNLFAIPGLMDAHMHIEATLLTPEALAGLIVPLGTTTVFVDPMEIANVAGLEGVKALLSATQALPMRIYLQVPSRVPTAPGLETTGGELGLTEVGEMLAWERTVSLGELDPSKVLGLHERYLEEVICAYQLGRIANGHAAGLSGRKLSAYITAGLLDDHECVDFSELRERLCQGMTIFVREGSTERNLQKILEGVLEHGVDFRHLVFCTDDKHPEEIQREGHINYNVNQAIAMGVPVIKAIQMACLNPATHFRLNHKLGSLAPGKLADVLLTPQLNAIEPRYVLVDGRLVAENGRLVQDPSLGPYPSWLRETVKSVRPIDRELFALKVDSTAKTVNVNVIKIYPDQIVNRLMVATLPVSDGQVDADPAQDILKLAVVERYGKNGNVACGFVRGFGLNRGALGSSVAHDHHNIILVGTNDGDLAGCVEAITRMQGGFVAVEDGQVRASLPLPIAGLMSDRPAVEVIQRLKKLNRVASSLGCPLPAPFMSLSFISLPSVPEFGITDRGLVDVAQHKIVSWIAEQ